MYVSTKRCIYYVYSTTNRIEAHHRVLKLHSKSSSWNIEKLLIIFDQHTHVVSHKEFIEKMYTTVNTSQLSANLLPFFQYCTGYAAHKVVEEYKKASQKSIRLLMVLMGTNCMEQ